MRYQTRHRGALMTGGQVRVAIIMALIAAMLMSSFQVAAARTDPYRQVEIGKRSTSNRAKVNRFERGFAAAGRSLDAQIVGGTAVPAGKYKFMAYVYVELTDGGALACGGSIIDKTHVLTAAHCLTDENGDFLDIAEVLVGVGFTDFDNICSECVINASTAYVHAGWDAETREYDAAVLVLNGSVPAGRTAPIALAGANSNKFDKPGRAVIVAGWGTTSSGGEPSDVLLETTVKVVSDSACNTQYGGGIVGGVMLCAAAPNRDSCQGDSGGPLFARNVIKKKHKKKIQFVQTGIVSFGIGCANPSYAGVYAEVSNPEIRAFISAVLDAD